MAEQNIERLSISKLWTGRQTEKATYRGTSFRSAQKIYLYTRRVLIIKVRPPVAKTYFETHKSCDCMPKLTKILRDKLGQRQSQTPFSSAF